jgi:hypothetical protein
MGDANCPYVIEIGLPDGKQTVASLSTAKDALAALELTAAEHPRAIVMLYVNGLPVMEFGPLEH